LPTLPPTKERPYTGGQATGAARASLQRALDNYKTGAIHFPTQPPGADLSRSDTRSFGETHASELSSISSDITLPSQSGIPLTPPSSGHQTLMQSHTDTESKAPSAYPSSSPHINPSQLNQSPALIPTTTIPPTSDAPSTTSPVPIGGAHESSATKIPAIHPTVAETGVPVSGGPGPASGSLHDIHAASPSAGPRSGGLPGNTSAQPSFGQGTQNIAAPAAKFESAEEEKKRLEKEDREKLLATGGSTHPAPGTASNATQPATGKPNYESADDEKKRLEREERERVLRGDGTQPKKDGDDLPPYADL